MVVTIAVESRGGAVAMVIPIAIQVSLPSPNGLPPKIRDEDGEQQQLQLLQQRKHQPESSLLSGELSTPFRSVYGDCPIL